MNALKLKDAIIEHRKALTYANKMHNKAMKNKNQAAACYWMGKMHAEEKALDSLWAILS